MRGAKAYAVPNIRRMADHGGPLRGGGHMRSRRVSVRSTGVAIYGEGLGHRSGPRATRLSASVGVRVDAGRRLSRACGGQLLPGPRPSLRRAGPCARCLVRDSCLAYALEHDERDGVLGGLSTREAQPPAPAPASKAKRETQPSRSEASGASSMGVVFVACSRREQSGAALPAPSNAPCSRDTRPRLASRRALRPARLRAATPLPEPYVASVTPVTAPAEVRYARAWATSTSLHGLRRRTVRPRGGDGFVTTGSRMAVPVVPGHPSTGQACRVLVFDKRGTGLSTGRSATGPGGANRRHPRVMDARVRAGRDLRNSEAGPMALLFAATYPDRAQALVLYGTFARCSQAPG